MIYFRTLCEEKRLQFKLRSRQGMPAKNLPHKGYLFCEEARNKQKISKKSAGGGI
jgi:hypothetical protein